MAAAATFGFAANGLQPRSGSPGAANSNWAANVTGTDTAERRLDADSQLIERCLSYNATRRPERMSEVQGVLDRLADEAAAKCDPADLEE